MSKRILQLTVNGNPVEVAVKPGSVLVDVLRRELGLTGTKKACNSGACSSCTVLIDGRAVNSCSVLAVQAEGHEITTIEGMADGSKLHPLQEAFMDKGGYQCGFCTSGMLLAAKALLAENPSPTAAQVREAISGNLCRCTGYVKIVDSILEAAKRMREGRK